MLTILFYHLIKVEISEVEIYFDKFEIVQLEHNKNGY